MDRATRNLVFILRSLAAVTSLALVPVFMPHAWMDQCHRLLGLGPLVETPMIAYLTRTLSGMYALHAAVLWLAAYDVRRYAPLVMLLGCWLTFSGPVLVGIDLYARLPLAWVLGEGPVVTVLGLAILVLQRKLPR